jgi:alpha-L-rhamnosidase
MKIVDLRCEYSKNPIGIDTLNPRLSWVLESDERGQKQTGYRILVASSPEILGKDKGDLWDTGKVKSKCSVHHEYSGKSLKSGIACHWKVKTWDRDGIEAPWSEPASWDMGLLDKSDWQALWIGSAAETASDRSSPCPFLRRGFKLRGAVARARLYASALGLYEIELNGNRVGIDYFTPGWTDYKLHVQYQSYDVTDMLQEGENVIGAILGDGWFSGYLGDGDKRNVYGREPRLLAQIAIEYADGRSELIFSDGSWKSCTGPILESDIYNGETYDARLETEGWSKAGFDDSKWAPVKLHPPKKAILNASASPRVRKIQELKTTALTEPKAGNYVFDFGQNISGWARLKTKGEAGTRLKLCFAEMLSPDGTVYTENLRSAKCTDEYILKGHGVETYEPRFTFHGFRYAELTGYPGKPSEDTLTAVVVHSDTPPSGSFKCSSTMLNRLQQNIQWGQRTNFLEVPTDCPQRDERLGWSGDAQVFIRTACFNMDVSGFFTKWIQDLADAQSPCGTFPRVAPDVLGQDEYEDGGVGWADAGIICPWTIHLCYGDMRILEKNYVPMSRFMDFLTTVDWSKRICFGDWLNMNDPTPNELIGVAYYGYCANIMSGVAKALGKDSDREKYLCLFKNIKNMFRREFVTSTGRLAGDSQTAYVIALHFNLMPKKLRAAAGENLIRKIRQKKGISTGFLGTPRLLFALKETGHLDAAYKLLLNEDFPSWGYQVKQGATTMWERWDGWHHLRGFQNAGMNSFNHYAYGAVGEWLYQVVAGIDIDSSAPGYEHLHMSPCPGGGLENAEATYNSIRGEISSSWRIEKDKFIWEISLPPGTTATIYVPGKEIGSVTENEKRITHENKHVKFLRIEKDRVVFKIDSGNYQFTSA